MADPSRPHLRHRTHGVPDLKRGTTKRRCRSSPVGGSCWNKLTGPLQAEGYEVIAAQYGLDTNEADFAATRNTLKRVHSPATLVGHSYGGADAPVRRYLLPHRRSKHLSPRRDPRELQGHAGQRGAIFEQSVLNREIAGGGVWRAGLLVIEIAARHHSVRIRTDGQPCLGHRGE